MYAITHNRIAKNAPSQNPPSNVNLNIFSNHGFLLADIHITKTRIVNNKARRNYTTFWMRHNTNATAFATRFKLMPQL